MENERDILNVCLTRLKELKPIHRVTPRHSDRPEEWADGSFVIDTTVGLLSFRYVLKKNLSLPALEHLILGLPSDVKRHPHRILILTDYILPSLTKRLIDADINFVDTAGNAYLFWPHKLHIQILGQRRPRIPEKAAVRLTEPSGLQILYALLTRPSLASMQYRALVQRSGVALGSVARVMSELKEKGYLQKRRANEWHLLQKKELLDIWVGGYANRLRPKLLLGQYQPPERDLSQTLSNLETELRKQSIDWCLTGGFAADRLTQHFRGNQLAVFIDALPEDFIRELRWLPSPNGPVTLFRKFSRSVQFEQLLTVAHPLLVYAELVFSSRERELETAKIVYDRWLRKLVEE
jgi:hypothetical protein